MWVRRVNVVIGVFLENPVSKANRVLLATMVSVGPKVSLVSLDLPVQRDS